MYRRFLLNLLLAFGGPGYNLHQDDVRQRAHAPLQSQADKDAFVRTKSFRELTSLSRNVKSLSGTPLTDFLPYGSNAGDKDLPTLDDTHIEVPLAGSPFHFFNKTYTSIFLNTNGGATFGAGTDAYNPVCGSLDLPMIAPYWTDVDTRNGGAVHYRQTTRQADLDKAKALVNRAFPETQDNLKLQWAFVITWDEVAFFGAASPTPDCPGSSLRNTFQAVIVQDKINTFVVFLYNKLTWTTGGGMYQRGDTCTGRNPTVGKPARGGFDYGDNQTFYFLPGSCTEDITKITEGSNFQENGKWAFKITSGVINTCDIDCSVGEFIKDPYNCTTYYQCSNNIPYKMTCPVMQGGGRLVFNPSKAVCVYPKDYQCKPVCEH